MYHQEYLLPSHSVHGMPYLNTVWSCGMLKPTTGNSAHRPTHQGVAHVYQRQYKLGALCTNSINHFIHTSDFSPEQRYCSDLIHESCVTSQHGRQQGLGNSSKAQNTQHDGLQHGIYTCMQRLMLSHQGKIPIAATRLVSAIARHKAQHGSLQKHR